MGQGETKANSSSEYASISIHCARDFYTAGEILHGTVILNVTKSFPLDTFNVTLHGLEVLQKGNVTETYNVLLKPLPLQINGMTSVVQPGKYVLPFEFALPVNIPGTLPAVECHGVKAQIQYRARVEIRSSDVIIPSLDNMTSFVVRQPLIYDQNYTTTAGKELYSWWCFYRGISTVTVFLQKTGLHFREEELKVNLGLDNTSCGLDVTGFKFELREKFELKSQGKFGDAPIVEKKTLRKWKVKFRGPRNQRSETETTYRFKNDKDGKEINNMETIHGKTIRRTYLLFIVPIYNTCCLSTRPCFSIEIGMTAGSSTISTSQMQPRLSVNESPVIKIDGL